MFSCLTCKSLLCEFKSIKILSCYLTPSSVIMNINSCINMCVFPFESCFRSFVFLVHEILEWRIRERLGESFAVLDVISASAPFEIAIGRVSRERAARAMFELAGSASSGYGPCQRSRGQSVNESLFPSSCIDTFFFFKKIFKSQISFRFTSS